MGRGAASHLLIFRICNSVMAGLFAEDDTPDAPLTGPSLFGEAPATKSAIYRVLARTYRPRTFDDLIGQDALVRTLRNAFAMNRLAHAYMLTGVRGVGKTTTARILARALNCTGLDGTGGPTPDPCGVCENCIAILADRHPDVVEMDAASNTGVDDVREIIEATRFRPLSARIKVFIIDEVHMLSRQAFNALLKTLEEPPPHIKFVLATTEIRKVPVTVLSRCQRFDLRRVAADVLAAHFTRIAAREAVPIAPAGIALIARAADGSVRDGLSLLDQAIARGAQDGGEISAALVADMLGLADRNYVFDLMDALVAGDAAAALAMADAAYERGADPGVLLADLLGLAHLLTRMKAVPALMTSTALPEAERTRGAALAAVLGVPWLGRLWQMLLKGVAEVEAAPDRRAAAEMILIRLCYVADAPTPGELLKDTGDAPLPPPRGLPPGGGGGGAQAGASQAGAAQAGAVRALAADTAPSAAPRALGSAAPRALGFEDVIALAQTRRDAMLYAHLRQSVHLVRFAPPVIEFRPTPAAPRDLAARLGALLEAETGRRWTIVVSDQAGAPTLHQTEDAAADAAYVAAADHPLVRAILAAFPGAKLEAAAAAPEAEPDMPADWAAFAAPDEAVLAAPNDHDEGIEL
jgi:DNA polymerase-3 subunit gamma/tau